jgi:hypothetical protein
MNVIATTKGAITASWIAVTSGTASRVDQVIEVQDKFITGSIAPNIDIITTIVRRLFEYLRRSASRIAKCRPTIAKARATTNETPDCRSKNIVTALSVNRR